MSDMRLRISARYFPGELRKGEYNKVAKQGKRISNNNNKKITVVVIYIMHKHIALRLMQDSEILTNCYIL